jgi:hypothetical protein
VHINATMYETIWAQGGSVAEGGIHIPMGEIKGILDIGAISIAQQSISQLVRLKFLVLTFLL